MTTLLQLAAAAGISVVLLSVGIIGYLRGVVRGYGYAREPGNPEFREAGRFLRQRYAFRWPELNPPTDKAREVKIGELRMLVTWCEEQIADPLSPEAFKKQQAITREQTLFEIEEMEAGLR